MPADCVRLWPLWGLRTRPCPSLAECCPALGGARSRFCSGKAPSLLAPRPGMRSQKRQGSRNPTVSSLRSSPVSQMCGVVFTAAEKCVVLLVELWYLNPSESCHLRSCCALEGSPHSDGDSEQARRTSRLDHGRVWASWREPLEPLPLCRLQALTP